MGRNKTDNSPEVEWEREEECTRKKGLEKKIEPVGLGPMKCLGSE